MPIRGAKSDAAVAAPPWPAYPPAMVVMVLALCSLIADRRASRGQNSYFCFQPRCAEALRDHAPEAQQVLAGVELFRRIEAELGGELQYAGAKRRDRGVVAQLVLRHA